MASAKCAIGLSVHTGWAACVAAGGTLRAPRIEARERIDFLGQQERFVYHRASEMRPSEAEQFVAEVRKLGAANAKAAVARVVARLRDAGNDVVACAVVANDKPMPGTLEEIVAAHPRIHTAEGCFHRDLLAGAAEANRLRVAVLSPKKLGIEGAADELAAIGRAIGAPWSKDHRLAALAAWAVLKAR